MLENLAFPIVVTLAFLFGIRLMQSPRTALWGNRLGASSMALAVALTFWRLGLSANPLAWTALLLGAVMGVTRAYRARTIEMPQLVALLNGLGGAASALVIGASVHASGVMQPWYVWCIAATALGVGALTFTGSMVAMFKLQGRLSPRTFSFQQQGLFVQGLLFAGAALIIATGVVGSPVMLYAVLVVFSLYGLLMAMRVGGADMPVLISFLNALSGVAASISGIALGSLLTAGVGALVGVAGMILTQLMCRAMNRNLAAVLRGFQSAMKSAAQDPAEKTAEQAPDDESTKDEAPRLTEADIPALLREARTALIVPGYGMALAQAQQAVKDLMDALERDGKQIAFAIHPVAGRMPGHMHVLLAEVGVDYDNLCDMAAINDRFADTDMVIVVGACDVVNPAATTAEGTPIYGMPILRAAEARHVVVFNLDEKPGYSGVDNPLYTASHVITVWGNAAETIPTMLKAYQDSRD